ncbi:hypothetical protein [Staphylococcus intermedius]|uniref:Uncharacterized protein n=1 Tax=Staphylococcus intermedius NCTC 11048 TaxID=1141106 RepID=A0A380G3V8_STAIN|nr:hypothetical protein [Staphylococcus intermedius]PCF63989.1 hypothetical protein B5C04_08410 [Staphylococcus intermedius]PCF78704.1 hypothetical protein B4W74_08760 [Staphylococcus intermedius]PCF79677.1 hypothetical protein B4W70_08400 [Staphylococcus intermedius]PCF85972.1 hypothetical protein B4W76_09535 [Staphylococcus intermedius]PCF89664.1 hypothetical protein B4W75_02145 [Staphylococcus intermedius]
MNEETRSKIKSQIHDIRKMGYSWSEIKNTDFDSGSKESYLKNVVSRYVLAKKPVTSSDWDEIVNEMEELEKKVELRKLSD